MICPNTVEAEIVAELNGERDASAEDVDVDALDFRRLAWLRRASGDQRLYPWRLTQRVRGRHPRTRVGRRLGISEG